MAEGEPPFAEFPPLKVFVTFFFFFVYCYCYAYFLPLQTLFLLTTQQIPELKELSKWSADFISFNNLCLTKNTTDRPSAEVLLQVYKLILFLFLSVP